MTEKNYGIKEQIVNLALRLMGLAGKFVLTLYMGHCFSLASIGYYGLVFSVVIVLNVLMGQEYGYVVKRQIVGLSPVDALCKMRDQAALYLINYLVLGLVLVGIWTSNLFAVHPRYYVYVFVLAVSEGLGTALYNNMNLLNQQLWANTALFVRSALWIPVVILLSEMSDVFRNEDTVLMGWSVGSVLAVGIPLWCWRDWGWRELWHRPVAWQAMFYGVKKNLWIWMGTLSLVAGYNLDRTVVGRLLSIDYVGVLTFYGSFANAMLTLMESGVLSFAGTRLVAHYKQGNHSGFYRESIRAAWMVGLGGGFLGLVIGLLVPLLASYMGKTALLAERPTLWLLLTSTWIHGFSMVLYYILFAQHRDKPLWLGDMLFVIPVLGGAVLSIQAFGFQGLGYSAVISALLLCGWRFAYVYPLTK